MLPADLALSGSTLPPAFSDVVFPTAMHVHVHVASALTADNAFADLLTSVIVNARDGTALERELVRIGEELGLAVSSTHRDFQSLVVIRRAAEPYVGWE
jgi:hypothetical protein